MNDFTLDLMLVVESVRIDKGDVAFTILGYDFLGNGFDLVCQIGEIGAGL